tara:strand:+ start:503 stop:1033 length:531 start_codon:yes stop_codon:yes gene_type:complete
MEKIIILFSSIILFACQPNKKSNTEIHSAIETNATYYLIRHADKDTSSTAGDNPELTAQGKARAENWAEVLKNVTFDKVYSTDYIRTRETAEPIAADNTLEIEIYDPTDLYNQDFITQTQGKTVLVVGHSNTTAAFVNKILGEDRFSEIDESNYGNLYIVNVIDGKAEANLLYINK